MVVRYQDAVPPPPPGDWEGASEISLQVPLRHIPAGDARIFEGWAHVSGIDYQGHNIPAMLLEDAAAEYMRKNPVILWDHIRALPIGRVLRMRVEERGVYIRGEVLQGEQIRSAVQGDVDFPSIAQVADEAWGLLKTQWIRGLSIRVQKRGDFKEVTGPNGEIVKEPQEIIKMHEISITPIQVSPSAQIDGANLLAKALTWAPENPPLGEEKTMTREELLAAQEAYLKKVEAFGKTGEDLPDDFLNRHDILTKSLPTEGSDGGKESGDPPKKDEETEDGDDLKKSLDTQASEIKALREELAALKGTSAPPRARQTMDADPGAAIRPAGPVDGKNLLTKAIDLAGDPLKSARLGFEVDDLPHQYDLSAMIMAKSNGKLAIKEGVSISPHAQEYLRRCEQLATEGKL